MLEEIESIKTKGASADELLKFKSEQESLIFPQMQTKNFWLSISTGSFINDENPASILNYKNILKTITAGSIQQAGNTYFNENNMLQFILMPGE